MGGDIGYYKRINVRIGYGRYGSKSGILINTCMRKKGRSKAKHKYGQDIGGLETQGEKINITEKN